MSESFPHPRPTVADVADEMFPPRTFHCDECGFDARTMTDAELVTTIASFARRFRAPLTRFLPREDGAAVVRHRPAPEVWSALEYAGHVRDVLAFYRGRVELVLAEERPTFPRVEQVTPPERIAGFHDDDPAEVAEALAAEATALAALLDGLTPEQWERVGLSSEGDGAERPIRQLAERATHDPHHHLLDIGRSLRAARAASG
jgi:hypothetical protein